MSEPQQSGIQEQPPAQGEDPIEENLNYNYDQQQYHKQYSQQPQYIG